MSTHIIHRKLGGGLPVAVSGSGVFIRDAEGKDYLDGSCGAAVSCLGHDNARVIAAIKAQLDRLPFAHTSFFTNQPAEDLAAFLAERAPGDVNRVYFLSGGSEANETALKLCRAIQLERGRPERSHIIAREQSYHGNTLGALGIGGNPARRKPYEPMLADNVSHIPPCYAYRDARPDESAEDYGKRAATALEEEILRIGPERVAAFFAETVSGSTLGGVPPVPGYFKGIREICDRYEVLLVLDEIMCGMGRTGTLFACEQDGVTPDLVSVAKGLGGGYQPIGAVMMREALYQEITAGSGGFEHGHTYIGHATACACALAVQTVIAEDGLLDAVAARGAGLKDRLAARLGQNPHVGDIRGRGLFVGIELVADRETKRPFARATGLANKIKTAALARGLCCYPGNGTADGVDGDHILLAPPFIISEGELDLLVERLGDSIETVLQSVTASGDV